MRKSVYRTHRSSAEPRFKGHARHLRLYQSAKFTMAGHITESGYRVECHETEALAKTLGYMDRPDEEARGIWLANS
jgi:hypothetical protein